MYQEGNSNGGLYNSEGQIPVAYATIDNPNHPNASPTAQTDVNNNVVDVPSSDMSTRNVTTVAQIGLTNINIQGEHQQQTSEQHHSGHAVSMTTVANSSNGYHGGISLAALHNMSVPPSPGFFNGSCKFRSSFLTISIWPN